LGKVKILLFYEPPCTYSWLINTVSAGQKGSWAGLLCFLSPTVWVLLALGFGD